ncbi:MAG: hypothetical protein OET42_07600 [Deltaproteobacteria bacterium]|nr:hypothetical protein [Deltaproteobacteria bacterium]
MSSSALQPVELMKTSNSSGDSRQRQDHALARIIRETVSPDRKDVRPTGQPQGLGPEPYLHNILLGEFVRSATKEVLPEDGWKDCNIRDRSNGFVNQAGY